MIKIYNMLRFPLVLCALLLITGCLVLSGTFVLTVMLIENEDLVWNGEFYYDEVDLTAEDVWQDHGDDIKNIDLVGFELWAHNLSGSDNTYDVYITQLLTKLDDSSTREEVESDATPVLLDLPLPNGASYISYSQSFTYLTNTDFLKDVVKTGKFKLFAYPETGTNTNIHIDSMRVIVTLTAGK